MSDSDKNRPDTDNYLQLFLNEKPLIDTRAPVEFGRGAFPSAVNLPLMTDDERTAVGTCYKEQGQQAAIDLGHQLVYGDTKAQRVAAWSEFARQHPQGYLYCFRGGLRSQICQQWLREAGVDYPRVIGGYKAMRQFLLTELNKLCQQAPFIILAGHTGAAKTELLTHVAQAVDLEGHANHRGSAFGKRPDGQPSQIDFENAVIIDMIRKHHSLPDKSIVLEDESRLIGRCSLPPELRAAMAKAPVILLESSLEERVEHSWENYIVRKSDEWRAHLHITDAKSGTELNTTDQAFACFVDDLQDSLWRIRKRLGGERYAQIRAMMDEAIDAHRRGDPGQHRGWIRSLLQDYYDPMYHWQWQQHDARVMFRGNRQAVLDFLSQ
ncbi:tRNA 2-selenouridine(34) synthase MnmH [Pseudohongiella spirulinae]|uniref:tRNA 2-selenouridine synthase n=1 Tax=Pseudohongiella spirulinae TaxID=1249552 RepID=A0A0S2KHQ8_9GAMM|nr:tRNA 2-selenouridine(34) synthase MnmH [Pseudohongiella spirulinae]ALO47646.1 tRNA 2-selenouridine synthase [Pseudohongiella spirulinae]